MIFIQKKRKFIACLVSIHSIGVLIVGQSGIGKSEATHEVNTKRTFIYSWWCSFSKAYWR
nr:hypothetical protein [Mycoplasmopsis bovis]